SSDTGTLIDAPKGQLVARVEFLYGEVGVAPSMPGTFLIRKDPQAQPAPDAISLESAQALAEDSGVLPPGVDGDLAEGLDDSAVPARPASQTPAPPAVDMRRRLRRAPGRSGWGAAHDPDYVLDLLLRGPAHA